MANLSGFNSRRAVHAREMGTRRECSGVQAGYGWLFSSTPFFMHVGARNNERLSCRGSCSFMSCPRESATIEPRDVCGLGTNKSGAFVERFLADIADDFDRIASPDDVDDSGGIVMRMIIGSRCAKRACGAKWQVTAAQVARQKSPMALASVTTTQVCILSTAW